MNNKKIFLSLITVCALGNVVYTKAMFSKPTFDKEDKEHSTIQMPKERATELLQNECIKKNPNRQYILELIKQGADVNEKGFLKARPLHAAAVLNNLSLAILLIKNGAIIDTQDTDGNTPLHLACEQGSIDVAKLLCEKGADINRKNNLGNSPLHRACEFNHLKIVILLIQKGALVNATTNSLLTPLHIACDEGSWNIVNFLIENGANVNARNYRGNTPLHYACFLKNPINIMALLIKNGADVNAVTKSPIWTPLHAIAETNNREACKLLLESGADPFITTNDGMTALDIAYDLGRKNIITLLQSYSRQTNADADANMQKFFEELNQEAISKKKKTAKKKRKKTPQPQPTVEISPEANSTNFPQSSSDVTEDELIINQLLEKQLIENQNRESIVPADEIVIETPPTTASPVAPPTASAPVQKRPIKVTQQESLKPDIAHAPVANNGYQILIGHNLKWPHLNKNQEQLIKNNLLSLKNWPNHDLDIKQLKGEVNMYRLRVGNYRIIFAVDTARREIRVQKIGLRKEVYKQYKS